MIARCRSKCWIIQLKEEDGFSASEGTQRGVKGNIIIYPQKPSPICVVFVGSQPPSKDWLRTKAKPLTIRPKVVRNALNWLHGHNQFYDDIQINNEVLDNMPDEFLLPVHIEHVLPNSALDSVTSGYCPNVERSSELESTFSGYNPTVTFDKVVITDVDATATSNQLRAAALRHIHNNGAFIQIPHEPKPANEFMNPALFPMIYPTLFPYGLGGFENPSQSVHVSLKRHVKHLEEKHY
ncbi:hypothetical protein F5878DRAFT_653029 [Lentinula raphanica]|uniref:DUF6570 domain-containing protein n=1 Tax=Lentinula raphanica TaxID=153919 RepID=A0AA38UC45_9AGAR|nr:hypothetical protein F5878DRAFT_653029 [Lentinula raphanica]